MAVLEYIHSFIWGVINNAAITVPVIAWMVAQILKTIIYAIIYKKISWHRLFGDGGMPSAHSATVTALAFVVGHSCGFASPEFGMAVIFASVVMHDALGVRRETGKQAVSILTIAEVIKNYLDESDINLKTEKLKVFVGHTPSQVAFGSLLGFVIALLYSILNGAFA